MSDQGGDAPDSPKLPGSVANHAASESPAVKPYEDEKSASTVDASKGIRPDASADTTLDAIPDLEDGDQQEKPQASRVFSVSYYVRAGGATLALCAGMVNAVSFHALSTFVSHLTGSLSKVGLALEDSGKADADDSTLLVLSFLIGAGLTGFLIAKDTIHFGMALYDLCLLTEAGFLVCATFLYEHRIARYIAAAACGLQNGIATHWGGAVIRTTHVTGLFTDVGLLIGRIISIFCRKRCGTRFDDFDKAFVEDDLSKLSVLAMIAAFFLLGVYSGSHFYNAMKNYAFLVPAGITGSIGLAYSIYRVVVLHNNFFSDAEMEVIDVPIELQDRVSGQTVKSEESFERQLSKASRVGSKDHHGDVMCISRDAAHNMEDKIAGLDLHHTH